MYKIPSALTFWYNKLFLTNRKNNTLININLLLPHQKYKLNLQINFPKQSVPVINVIYKIAFVQIHNYLCLSTNQFVLVDI